MIYKDREDYKKYRKRYGVPSGLVKGVDMGQAFQTFADSIPKPYYRSDPAQTLAAIEELAPKLTTYAAALKRTHPGNQMLADLMAALKTLTSLKKQMSSFVFPMRYLQQYHAEATKELAVLKRDRLNKLQANHWGKFYGGPVRNIGIQLEKLTDLEPQYKQLYQAWVREMNTVTACINGLERTAADRARVARGLPTGPTIERILTAQIPKIKADLIRMGAWPRARGAAAPPPEPEEAPQAQAPTPPSYPAPQPPQRPRAGGGAPPPPRRAGGRPLPPLPPPGHRLPPRRK